MNRFFVILFFGALLQACSGKKVSNAEDYSMYLNNEANGFKKSKKVGDMLISVKYLPVDFLALKDLDSDKNKKKYDSLINSYKSSTTFLLSFQTIKGQSGEDVMTKGIENFEQYVERTMTLNFDLESKTKIVVNNKEYTPVLSSLENTYGLSKSRNVYLVFADPSLNKELANANRVDFVYSDDLYNVGILHFGFDKKLLDKNLPQVDIK